jgi:hypothetical protein
MMLELSDINIDEEIYPAYYSFDKLRNNWQSTV